MTILIVEDEVSIREVEAAYLQQAGYEVVEVADGRAAVNALESQTFGLVIVDLSLPGMSGLDVCRIIREKSAVPILIVTARNSDEDEIKGFEIGADDYIKKPFNPNVLVARAQALLRHHQSTKRLHFRGLTINPETMAVERDGKQITLTTTRFKLLMTLASQPNVVLSRAQLVDQIYNDPSSHIVYDRTVDAHIKALRHQLETDPRHPTYIETVIGSGYRFRTAK